nr:PREDICTED: uncharacterized protein LOC105678305 [Linepithema humile]
MPCIYYECSNYSLLRSLYSHDDGQCTNPRRPFLLYILLLRAKQLHCSEKRYNKSDRSEKFGRDSVVTAAERHGMRAGFKSHRKHTHQRLSTLLRYLADPLCFFYPFRGQPRDAAPRKRNERARERRERGQMPEA